MSSNNNDDKSEKKNLNINTENSLFKADFFEKQNLKTQKNKSDSKKSESLKQKDKDSIFSGSSNENDNNSSEENIKEQNDNNNYLPKDVIDINEPGDKNSPKKDNIDNKLNNLMAINKSEKNQKEENISRSMSSKSNLSRSRSRSLSEKNSHSDGQNKNIEQEKNSKNSGNKFKNYKNSRRQRNTANNHNSNTNNSFIMKNGCCRSCMKAFSKNGKSCLCQVPRRERKFILPETGCNYCGCHGCNPIDMKYNKRLQQKNLLFQDNTLSHKNQRILDSEDEDLKINDDLVDYYNRDKRDIQDNLSDMLKINSIFYGFGVPLRIPSYILGYNPNVNYYYEKKNLNNNNNNYIDYNMGANLNNNMGGNMNNNIGNNMNNYNYDLNMNNINNSNRFRRNNNYNNNFSSYGNNFGNNNFQNSMNNPNMNYNRNQRFRK